jgi:hypothetical protein
MTDSISIGRFLFNVIDSQGADEKLFNNEKTDGDRKA